MKHLKPFKVFEELDTDPKTDNKMRQNSSKFVEMAKKYEASLRQKGIKMSSKDVRDDNDKNKLWKEALDKIKGGEDKVAYGMMKWSGDICQSFSIISPAGGIEALRKPITGFDMTVSYTEEPGKWCTFTVYNTPENAKSLYMEVDGEVLFQWDSYENKAKGKLA